MVDKTNEKSKEQKMEERKKALSHLGAIVIGILIGILGLKNCEGENVELGPETLVQLPPVPTKTIAKLEKQTLDMPIRVYTRSSTNGADLKAKINIDFAPDLCPKPEPFSSLDCEKSLNEKERAAKATIACKSCAEDKGYGPFLAQAKVVVAKADECRKEARAKARAAAPTVPRRSRVEEVKRDAVVQAAIDACKTQGGRWGCCRTEVFKAFKAYKNLSAPGITDMDQLVKEVVSGKVSLPVTMADTDWYNSRVQACMGG